MSDCRLYLISPPALTPHDFSGQLESAFTGGDVASFQLRLKDCDDDTVRRAVETLQPVAHAHDVAFILNDRPDLVAELACDGVHVGQEDMALADARALIGDAATLGVTCHASRHIAVEAAEAGADYVAFGAFFDTSTKAASTRATPEILSWWHELIEVPCVAIGGITVENCAPLIAAGADFLAVSAGVWRHAAGAGAAVAAFSEILTATQVASPQVN